MTMDRSPEFFFKKLLIYMYLLKTNHAPSEPLVPQSSIWSKFKYGPLGGIRDRDLVVFKPGDFVCFNL